MAKNRQANPARSISNTKLVFFLAPGLLTIILLFGGGLVLGLLQALGYRPASTSHLSLHHFINVISDPDFLRSMFITLYIAATSTVIAAIISIALSLILVKYESKSRIVSFALQLPLTVPHLVIAIAITLLLTPSGLISRLLSSLGIIASSASFPLLVNDTWSIGILLVYVWKEVPFITFMLLSVMINVGPELDEVGATLNLSPLKRFRHITLPLIAPNLGGACLIVFAFTFGAFEVPYLLGRTYPMTLPVWAYKNYSDVDLLARPEGIALGLIIAAIVIVSVIVSQAILSMSKVKP